MKYRNVRSCQRGIMRGRDTQSLTCRTCQANYVETFSRFTDLFRAI